MLHPRRVISAFAKAGLLTVFALAEVACANRAASGESRSQSSAATAETTARNSPSSPRPPESSAPAEPLAPAVREPTGAEPQKASAAPEALLPWLAGRWKGRRKTCWPLSWSQPDESQAGRRNRCNEAGVRFALELTFTEGPGKLDGLLEAVAEDGARHEVVTFVIARHQASCSLVWHEGGRKYVFSYEPARAAQTCFDGPPARFSLERGPTSRLPYPIGIQLWLEEHELTLRRLQGPQHGAAVDQIYTFGPD